MGVCGCLGPWVKWIYGLKGFGEWVPVLRHWLMLPPLAPTQTPTHVYFAILIDLNHDTEPWHEPQQLNHDMNHDEIVSFARCSTCCWGNRQWECTVLEIFAWLPASKTAWNCCSRTNPRITGNLPGYWLCKIAEIAVLRLIHVSQENWRIFFVILLSNKAFLMEI